MDVNFEIDISADGSIGIWQRPGSLELIQEISGAVESPWINEPDSWIIENGLCG